jgi:hypothetical protein
MRLAPGISLDYANDVLRRAETTWGNALSAQDPLRAYTDAVHDTYPTLAQVFVTPDLAAGLRSTAYWNLLPIGRTQAEAGGFITRPCPRHEHKPGAPCGKPGSIYRDQEPVEGPGTSPQRTAGAARSCHPPRAADRIRHQYAQPLAAAWRHPLARSSQVPGRGSQPRAASTSGPTAPHQTVGCSRPTMAGSTCRPRCGTSFGRRASRPSPKRSSLPR